MYLIFCYTDLLVFQDEVWDLEMQPVLNTVKPIPIFCSIEIYYNCFCNWLSELFIALDIFQHVDSYIEL